MTTRSFLSSLLGIALAPFLPISRKLGWHNCEHFSIEIPKVKLNPEWGNCAYVALWCNAYQGTIVPAEVYFREILVHPDSMAIIGLTETARLDHNYVCIPKYIPA